MVGTHLAMGWLSIAWMNFLFVTIVLLMLNVRSVHHRIVTTNLLCVIQKVRKRRFLSRLLFSCLWSIICTICRLIRISSLFTSGAILTEMSTLTNRWCSTLWILLLCYRCSVLSVAVLLGMNINCRRFICVTWRHKKASSGPLGRITFSCLWTWTTTCLLL